MKVRVKMAKNYGEIGWCASIVGENIAKEIERERRK